MLKSMASTNYSLERDAIGIHLKTIGENSNEYIWVQKSTLDELIFLLQKDKQEFK